MLRSFITGLAAFAIAFGAQAQTIKIAILGPMAFVQGENHWAGAEMAREEINKAGGINVGGKRMQVELVRADTNEMTSVPDATNAMERVITRDKADFLIGGFRSEAVLAMQEVAMDYKKIFLGAGAAHSKLGLNVEQNYSRYKYWFRYTPTKDVDLARTLFAVLGSIGQQIRTDLKTETPKVAILAEKAVWTEGLPVHVAHRDLRFGVGPQPRQAAVPAHLGVPLHQPVRVEDRHRHELRRLVARKSVHETLIARALLEIEALALVHPLRDVCGLPVVGDQHRARAIVETGRGIVVADTLDHVARDFGVIEGGACGDLPRHHDEAGGAERFGRDAPVLVLGEHGVQYGVGDLVGDLVGVAFGNGLGSEEEIGHLVVS